MKKPIIYHADDDEGMRFIVKHTFDKLIPEFRPFQFKSGEDLEKRFLHDLKQGTLPTGIIVDHLMQPGITGLDFIKNYSNHLPIIMASSSEIRDEALKHGAAAYISKPFDVYDFSSLVKDTFGKR